MRALIMGPPGVGKGTQAASLAVHLGVPAISTGQMFREHVVAGTSLGRSAQRHLDAGEYVPDDLTNELVEQRLSRPDAAEGFLLDGYPRTAAQIFHLDTVLASGGTRLDLVITLRAGSAALLRRLRRRARVEGRLDDTEEVIRHRLAIYAETTEPLELIYRDRGIVVGVHAIGSADTVRRRLAAAVDERRG